MIYRANHKKNYTVIDNNLIHNLELSIKARYLLILMLSLPDDWRFSVSGLSSIMGVGITAVRSALAELTKNGYIVITKQHKPDGKFIYRYDIYETPCEKSENRQQSAKTEKTESSSAKASHTKSISPVLKTAIDAFCDMRRKMGKPLTKAGYKRLLLRLDEWTPSAAEQAEIVNKSVERGWLDVYKPGAPAVTRYVDPFAPQMHSDEEIRAIEEMFLRQQCRCLS